MSMSFGELCVFMSEEARIQISRLRRCDYNHSLSSNTAHMMSPGISDWMTCGQCTIMGNLCPIMYNNGKPVSLTTMGWFIALSLLQWFARSSLCFFDFSVRVTYTSWSWAMVSRNQSLRPYSNWFVVTGLSD